MKHDWEGSQDHKGGWAIFRTNGIVTKRIYFSEFADYWAIVGIIDQEVKRKLGAAVDAIRDAANKLEEEI